MTRLRSEPLPNKLYRRTEPVFARAFLEVGELRLVPLSYYRVIEGHKKDSNEAHHKISTVAPMVVEVRNPTTGQLITRGLLDTFSGESGTKLPHWFNVLCMSTSYDRLDPIHGPSLIIVDDVAQFYDRFGAAVLRIIHTDLHHGAITYYNSADMDMLTLPTANIWQYKRSVYADENENRFCAIYRPWDVLRRMCMQSGRKCPRLIKHSEFAVHLKIGSLLDIARVIDD